MTGRERAKRRVVGFNDLPANLVKAITVTEDRSFFEHYGVNIRGIIRALVRRYDGDPNSPMARQGGSSITQQLVKNLLLSPETTMASQSCRKLTCRSSSKRGCRSRRFSRFIATRFTWASNQVSRFNGFGEASNAYFNKDVTNLTLPESAFLAGIDSQPESLQPLPRSRNCAFATQSGAGFDGRNRRD